jgi:alginate O-acetyltransferase complex protein AlgI
MLFNSLSFLLFFPIVTVVYFALPHRFRWAWLLAASCFFYMSFVPAYILILFLTIVVDYVAALKIEASTGRAKRVYLIVSIVSTMLILFVFKYFNFVNDNLAELAKLLGVSYPIPALKLILPIGLSFHTFQSLSYVIEVYRGNQRPERHFGVYALYVMFYPQLVAGPIERPQNMLHQFHEEHRFDADRAVYGFTRIAYGLFKKVVVADRVALYVNEIYLNLDRYSTIPVLLAVFFFSIQIYCDFSGYSDVAVGTAEVMGFRLMENFDRPYLSASISEFWKRWHISLSTWLRDYVYIPLGGSRVSPARRYFNLVVTFFLSGIWHGANWTFLAWGLIHGVGVAAEAATARARGRVADVILSKRLGGLRRVLGVAFTFAFVSFAWIFFRATSMRQAFTVVRKIFRFELSFNLIQISGGLGPFNLFLSLLVVGLLLASYALPKTLRIRHNLSFACAVTAAIFLLGKGSASEFIYFQF